MMSDQIQSQQQIKDGTYLKIWQIEQAHQRTRWTVVTFFMSISFAILGFSFQSTMARSEALAIRIAGLLIFWFAYVLLIQFYSFTKFLRNYLMEMEKTGRTTFDIQSKIALAHISGSDSKRASWKSTARLILYFGLIYTLGVILLWLLGL